MPKTEREAADKHFRFLSWMQRMYNRFVIRRPAPGSMRVAAQQDADRLADLMSSYQNGDLEAFETLYYTLKTRLHQYLVSLTFGLSNADDLLQETFLQLHRSRRTYQPGRPVIPWVFAIARHVFLMDCRARGHRHKQFEASREDLASLPVPPEVSGLGERQIVEKALQQVPQDRREALLLHHVWGFTFKEIGGLLGIRRGTAKLRSYRGMENLRQAVSNLSHPKGK